MADDRDRNQGMRQGGQNVGAGEQGTGGAHEAPGRNPGEGQQAGQQGGEKKGDFDPNRGDGGKEGGQNDQTRR